MTELKSSGILRYSRSWLVVDCCDDLAKYYRRYIKQKCLVAPPYGSHITVVAGTYEKNIARESWGKYEGVEIEFTYSHDVKYGDGWYCLEIKSDFLSSIRLELGLKPTPKWPFHLTVAKDEQYALDKIVSA
jgi:hypothetical protein